MAKFVLLYSGGSGMAATEAEQAAVVQEWTAWFTSLGTALVDYGAPFMPAAATVGTGSAVSAGGYTVIQADSAEAAVALAKGSPQIKAGGAVTVFPTIQVM